MVVRSLLQLSEKLPCHVGPVGSLKFAPLETNLVGFSLFLWESLLKVYIRRHVQNTKPAQVCTCFMLHVFLANLTEKIELLHALQGGYMFKMSSCKRMVINIDVTQYAFLQARKCIRVYNNEKLILWNYS